MRSGEGPLFRLQIIGFMLCLHVAETERETHTQRERERGERERTERDGRVGGEERWRERGPQIQASDVKREV